MKKIFTLLMLLCLVLGANAQKKKVGYFTFQKTLDATATTVQLDPVFLMLQADANLDVTLNVITTASATPVPAIDQSLYDVLVIQESFSGNAGVLTPAGALGLAKLTKPTVFNKNYALAPSRAFAAGTTGAGAETLGSTTSTLVSIKVDPANQYNDLFKDITFVGDSVALFVAESSDAGVTGAAASTKAINYAKNVVLSNTNTLIAKPVTIAAADQSVLTVSFNDLPAGTVIGGETLASRVITVGMNFGAICATNGANITSNGLKIFKNAVYSLAGLYPTPVKVTGITVSGGTAISTYGGTLQLTAGILPIDAANKNVTWSVDNTAVATINAAGLLTAVSNGSVVVMATAIDGSGKTGIATIAISNQVPNVPVTGVTVTGTGGATTITSNAGTLQMLAAVAPANATTPAVTWSVTNGTGQATISAAGLLTASKNGTVTVKATSVDVPTISGQLDITITGQTIAVTGITVTGTGGATTITTNAGTLQMLAAVAPADATTPAVTWSVTNGTGQASISAAGLLTASKNGTVTVKATATDGSAIFGTLVVTLSNQGAGVTIAKAQKLGIYPNPVLNEISMDGASIVKKYEVISLNGKLSKQGINTADKLTVNVSDLAPGVYFFKIYTSEGVEKIKFVKN